VVGVSQGGVGEVRMSQGEAGEFSVFQGGAAEVLSVSRRSRRG
jgi:hypothetical protein